MDKVRAFLARKVMGVPVGVFAALFMGGLLFYAIRMPRLASETTDTSGDESGGDVGSEDLAGDIAGVSNPVFSAGVPSTYQTSGPTVTAVATTDTNELWGKRVQEWLVAQGASVDVASSVVYKYLNGVSLTSAEVIWRDKAVKQFGFPPESVDVVAPTPDPAPTPPSTNPTYNGPAVAQGKPPLNHTVKGTTDNQPAELARLYYGSTTADAVNKIKSANLTKVDPYAKGTKVRIPAKYTPVYYRATAATRTLYDIARKNGVTAAQVTALNPGMKFPVKAGARVRVR